MCQVDFECYLWIQWEESFQKHSSASQASERNFWLEILDCSPPLLIPMQSNSSVPNIAHLETSVTNALCLFLLTAVYENGNRAHSVNKFQVENMMTEHNQGVTLCVRVSSSPHILQGLH